ncbi:hypothetical protein EYC80_003561 [Monilinia laxa]|uniref:Uncharacterized protein n=1 Tax=Monilinia laxa TaxID=61186 RepID=A0A5N6KKL7_MONLA|nr:hypothetical protein EYC80_003561 [Monilinia laxa]
MQTLPLEDRMAYLLHAQTSLSFRINEVRHYIQQLRATERAQDLEAMNVIEKDLLRTTAMVLGLQERHRLGSASNNSRPPTPVPQGVRGRRASLAPTTTEEIQPRIVSPSGGRIGKRYKKAAIRGKIEAVKKELGFD